MADDESGEVNDVFVSVHAGAGNHSRSHEHLYKSVCSLACQQAMTLLKARRSALEAVTAAVVVLENDECTNAGRGSNLTMQGAVECDASVMDGQSLMFGAVGALSGVANPVSVARRLAEEQKLGALSCGRVRPSILVGKGAQLYCCDNGIDVNANLISAAAVKTFIRYKRRCLSAESTGSLQKRRRLEVSSPGDSHQTQDAVSARDDCVQTQDAVSARDDCVQTQDAVSARDDCVQTPDAVSARDDCVQTQDAVSARDDCVQDTVGAVCVDHEGNVAAATSSGGIWLKHSGRLGPAGIYGAGCWAQNQISESRPGVAAVTSGCGEDLMMTVLAKTCSDAIRSSNDLSQSLAQCFSVQFLGSEFLASKLDKFGGVLILKTNKSSSSKEVELSWIHSTSSLCLAYMAGKQKSPTTVMSRLDEGSLPGQSFMMGGHRISLSSQSFSDMCQLYTRCVSGRKKLRSWKFELSLKCETDSCFVPATHGIIPAILQVSFTG